MGAVNITGEKNNAFLVQEFIEGEEFVVDMVVDDSLIHTVSLCRYRKGEHNGSRFVYEYMEMLDPHLPEFADLVRYAHQCCKALGFEVGPVHMEIMKTKDRIVMIEAGGRLHGGVAPKIFQQCYQPDLLTQAVNCYHKNAEAIQTVRTRFAKVLFMINDKKNAIFNAPLFEQQSKLLASFYDMAIGVFETLPLTVDLLTCPCYVLLVSAEQQQIENDEQRLREIFQNCLQ